MEQVLKEWSSVLREEPGETNVLEHEIVTGDVPPMRTAPYQLPEKWCEDVRKEIGTLKVMGILVPSSSPWGSPIVPVAKQDGSVRVCGDSGG